MCALKRPKRWLKRFWEPAHKVKQRKERSLEHLVLIASLPHYTNRPLISSSLKFLWQLSSPGGRTLRHHCDHTVYSHAGFTFYPSTSSCHRTRISRRYRSPLTTFKLQSRSRIVLPALKQQLMLMMAAFHHRYFYLLTAPRPLFPVSCRHSYCVLNLSSNTCTSLAHCITLLTSHHF